MAALTESASLRHRGKPSQISFVVADGVTVLPGSLVSTNAAGFLIPYAQGVGVRVQGIMNDGQEKTGDAAGSVEASVDVAGVLLEQITVTGVSGQTDVGLEVYGLTDNVNDIKIAQGASQAAIGAIVRFYSATIVDVWLRQGSQIFADA